MPKRTARSKRKAPLDQIVPPKATTLASEIIAEALSDGIPTSDMVVVVVDPHSKEGHALAVDLAMLPGVTEKEARRRLLQEMTKAAAAGERTMQATCWKRSEMLARFGRNKRNLWSKLLRADSPPGAVLLLVATDIVQVVFATVKS